VILTQNISISCFYKILVVLQQNPWKPSSEAHEDEMIA